jgi:hypothetical protein
MDEDPDRTRTDAPARRPESADGNDTSTILDLQERAGNRAVTGLLAGPDPAAVRGAVQREPAEAPAAEPADARKATGGTTMTIRDLETTVPIQSFSLQSSGVGGGETRPTRDAYVMLNASDADPRLQRAAIEGRQFKTITITAGPQTYTLHDVVITSYSVSQETVALSLNYGAIEIGTGTGAETGSSAE